MALHGKSLGIEKPRKPCGMRGFLGEPGGIRTHDLLIRRENLDSPETVYFSGSPGFVLFRVNLCVYLMP